MGHEQRMSVPYPAVENQKLLPIDGRLLVPTEDYARVPFSQAFGNFSVLLPRLHDGAVVKAFYSKRNPKLKLEDEYDHAFADQIAYIDAAGMGGLITYFGGLVIPPSRDRNLTFTNGLDFIPDCLSFCIWDSEEQAQNAAKSIPHQVAAKRASSIYERYVIRTFDVRIEDYPEEGLKDIIFEPRQG